jgi:hypothetical protein
MMDQRDFLTRLKTSSTIKSQTNWLQLLPEKFTMPELQNLEVILGKKLNRGNFYRKCCAMIFLKTNEVGKGGAHKDSNFYKFEMDTWSYQWSQGGW